MNKEIIVAKDKNHLISIIKDEIAKYGHNCNLNHIDVSNVEDMSYLFCQTFFDGDISNWDVSNVKNLDHIFFDCKFTGDVSKWNISNITNYTLFYGMFTKSFVEHKVENCGKWKRTIYLNRIDNRLVHVCDFVGTKEEALSYVDLCYDDKPTDAEEYKKAINYLFAKIGK